ncbi:MAG TPA: CoA-transferase, partial [Acidimicrobiales bacterium]|nr:CoA-transferase [Acidimicrobiales bacterium]
MVSLTEAIAELIHDGDAVALEGFTHLIPMAAGHEIIRQGRRDLTLIRMTPDLIYDQMIGAGCARRLVFSWGGNPGVGSLHRFRDAVENQWPHALELEEHTHAGMANRYVAGPHDSLSRWSVDTPAPTTSITERRTSPRSPVRSRARSSRPWPRCVPTSRSPTRSAQTDREMCSCGGS